MRQKAGLGRARLALVEILSSLRMMRLTQGLFGGAQSWNPLRVVNLEAEKGAVEPTSWKALPGGAAVGDPTLIGVAGTSLKGLLLARRRGIREWGEGVHQGP